MLIDRQETSEADVESARLVFSIDCWDDDAFEILGIQNSNKCSSNLP